MAEDVTPDSSPTVPVDVPTPPAPTAPEPAAPAPGSQTPPENLLAALKEERRMRKEAEDLARQREEDLERVRSQQIQEGEVFSDEGKHLDGKIKVVQDQLQALQDLREIEALQNQFPALKDKASEFDAYRKDYPRHKLANVAKLFLQELGVLEEPRKGLERPAGASHVPAPVGMSVEDVEALRKNNYRKYMELVVAGKINVQ